MNMNDKSVKKSYSKPIVKSKLKKGTRYFNRNYIYAAGGIIVALIVVICLIVIYYPLL